MCRPPAMSANRPAASNGGPVVSHTRHPVGDRVPVSRCTSGFDRCAMAPETRPLPAVLHAHPARNVDRLSCGVRRGEAVIPPPIVWGRWLLLFPGRTLPVLSPGRFGCASAGYVDRPQAAIPSSAGNCAGSSQWSPLPPSRPCRRSNSDHAGKSMYSGEIESLDRDPGIATLVPGMRFPGN